jgi:galactitol-specific phosphotransferase system IIC component
MIFLIIAQGARLTVIWVKGKLIRKILKSIIVTAIGFFLAQRHIEYREKYESEKLNS